MIALGGPKLKLEDGLHVRGADCVSMIALGGPKLKLCTMFPLLGNAVCFNDSTGWA